MFQKSLEVFPPGTSEGFAWRYPLFPPEGTTLGGGGATHSPWDVEQVWLSAVQSVGVSVQIVST